MNLLNPFDEVFNHTYFQIRKKIEKFYGVTNADEYFNKLRKTILDKCVKDTHKIKEFDNLLDYCAHVQMVRKYGHEHTEVKERQSKGEANENV